MDKEKGEVTFGRPRVAYPDFNFAYSEWKAGRTTAASAMRSLGMKANTFYRRVKEVEKN